MNQNSLGLPNCSRRTRMRDFPESMDRVVQWFEFVSLIEPFATESGRRGQQPFAVVWAQFGRPVDRYLPRTRVLHAYPHQRFAS